MNSVIPANEMIVVFFDKNGYNPLGSDGTYYAQGLKTIRGLQNRMNRKDFVNCTNYQDMMIVPHYIWENHDVYELKDSGNYPIYKVADFQYSKENLNK